MSIAQIREQIEELSYEERVELSEWLQITTPVEDDDLYLQETLVLAEQRSEELRSGKVKAISEAEFWDRVDSARYGEVEDAELALAEKRDAEIEAGTKKLLSEEEFWKRMHEFKSALR
jgi:predicted DNA-binding protein